MISSFRGGNSSMYNMIDEIRESALKYLNENNTENPEKVKKAEVKKPQKFYPLQAEKNLSSSRKEVPQLSIGPLLPQEDNTRDNTCEKTSSAFIISKGA